MEKKSILVNILYWFCNISFYFLIIWIVTAISFEVFTEDGKVGGFSSGSHHSNGYQMPVNFNVKPKAPIYNNELFKLNKEGVNVLGQSYSTGSTTYSKPITSKDSLDFKSIVSIHNKNMIDYYELESTSYISTGYITLKPKTLKNKVVMVVRTYLGFFIVIVVFFFLRRIFIELKTNFQFSLNLFRAINVIGILLIIHVSLKAISNFILARDLPYISVQPLVDIHSYVTVSMNPRLDFEFTLFLIGFMLIVLSRLLKKGKQIQQENDLTI